MSRIIKSSGAKAAITGKIGGEFHGEKTFVNERLEKFDAFKADYLGKIVDLKKPIAITMPDGSVKEGIAFETTPMDIAVGISAGFARSIIACGVEYAEGVEPQAVSDEKTQDDLMMWHMNRPLEGDCKIFLYKPSSKEGQIVLRHSAAHITGEVLEQFHGVKLTHGPPTETGFYYDGYMGNKVIKEDEFKPMEKLAQKIIKEKQPFECLVVSKEQALDIFSDNVFKQTMINAKMEDGQLTSVYRCGPFIDWCLGPHVPTTGSVKVMQFESSSSCYWQANTTNDSLQRLYGVAFTDKKELKAYNLRKAEQEKRRHDVIGPKQELFFFHQLSPGSAFFLPHGTRIYNTLISFIQEIYWKRGYNEVVTPNVFDLDLWRTSGHAQHYKENMFCFDVEGREFGMKPMNCPGHCLLFDQRIRSHRELPLRIADFGVLHRNELSGALRGLTRVRRFQQDDAHIFCAQDQIMDEVHGVLDFINTVYGTFGFKFQLELSTRPEKALGAIEIWNHAEELMGEALEKFGHGYEINEGDGAFYGPKIDVQVFDALGRSHQCATCQLDFQLPLRFNLKFRRGEMKKASEEIKEGELPEGMERPVMIHRAILGSVERMFAILVEHYGGKWPFWLSPRQVCIVPVTTDMNEYAHEVQKRMHNAGFFVDVDDSKKRMQKKIREAQLAQYNYIFVVGQKEMEDETVNVRTRDNKVHGTRTVTDIMAELNEERGMRKLPGDLPEAIAQEGAAADM
eukprot:TRINITY_DN780016_c0_g1_i1.p1 TRINITY_DN780016_c0_g1~~TRINITY_DN780016_c0_g1_i1.p1  ORF type:complete len:737 (-),score=267.70 TRINITY_DN780016_c0_g1_i1:93-2303(-)